MAESGKKSVYIPMYTNIKDTQQNNDASAPVLCYFHDLFINTTNESLTTAESLA